MRIFRYVSLLIFGVGVALLGGCGGTESKHAHRPDRETPQNIVWISIEDLSLRLGAYGDSIARTPNIDRLAEEGLRFTNAFATAGVCAPNRSAIITGMYQTAIGTHHMRTTSPSAGPPVPYHVVPPPYVKTFTEYLRAEGYFTTNDGKTDYQFQVPITAWDINGEHAHWRSEKRAEGQPFFAMFNFGATHESATWPDSNETLTTDPSAVPVPPYYPDTPRVRRALARHYDNIAEVDEKVGRLLHQLEEDGLADNTIVFLWSDHGDGMPRAKRWLYDSGIHVPLMVRWPGHLSPGSVSDRLVSSVDLGPTVLSLTGAEIPAHMQGEAFLGPEADDPREYVFAARDRHGGSYDMVRAVRDKRYKYIRNYYPNRPYVVSGPYRDKSPIKQELLRLHALDRLDSTEKTWFGSTPPPEELYDTASDPHEVANMANDPEHQDVLRRMRRAMDRWMEKTDDMGEIPESQMVERMWPDGTQPTTSAPFFRRYRSLGAGSGPVVVRLYCKTQGASLAYTTDEGQDPHWRLYHEPLSFEEPTTVRARAIRYGYKSSEVVSTTLLQNGD